MNRYHWWQTGIIYQIYPRSFQDSNGDGIGDLPGIIQRLDYIENLGVDVVWLSPVYPSPMADFGYDVSDYCDIHPIFGNLADFDRLLAQVHRRHLKLILDLVPNHTSDQHRWFAESRRSRDSYRRDWYIWRDPAPDGGPPNNWLSFFGGPAWSFDEHTGQYYLHLFSKHQPDLNYRHPGVLAAMLHNMRFWLDRGVDGFRVDVIWLLIKDEKLRNEPPNPDWDGQIPYNRFQHIYTQNQPEVHDIIRQMRTVLDEYDNCLMVGEVYLPLTELVKYYGPNLNECHLPFNFQLITLDCDFHKSTPWDAQIIRQIVERYEAALPGDAWPNWVLGNHDVARIATRVGPDQARVAQMLLLTLRGTPTCYYGDEIGMENGKIPPESVQDPMAVNQPELAETVGRDPQRLPMPWNASPNAGFTGPEGQPWLPLPNDYHLRNVAGQEQDPTSLLNLFKSLTQLRRAAPSLHQGDYTSIEAGVDNVFSYTRAAPNADRFLIVLNFSSKNYTLNLNHVAAGATIVLSTTLQRNGPVRLSNLSLGPNEGLVLRLT